MRSTTLRRARSYAFAVFVSTVVGSSSFAACTSLKDASFVEDAGTEDSGVDVVAVDDAGDGRAENDGARGDASDVALDAGRSRRPSCAQNGALCACTSWPFEMDSSSCAAADFPSGFCCADPGWPNESNATCTCGAWTCHTTGSGACLCGAYVDGSAGASCTDTYCCAHPDKSTCGCASSSTSACVFGDADVPVSSCTVAQQPCPRGGTRVASCSF